MLRVFVAFNLCLQTYTYTQKEIGMLSLDLTDEHSYHQNQLTVGK